MWSFSPAPHIESTRRASAPHRRTLYWHPPKTRILSGFLVQIRLGTRNSPLARWQAEWVAAQLTHHGHQVELVPITTSGDRQTQQAIAALGATGLFTKELQRALLAGQIDLAVHSLKDLPTDAVPGLTLGAVPPRAPVADALISRSQVRFADLPSAAKVGTGSPRRRSQLLHRRPDLQMAELRGNVDTRLAKLAAGEYDAIVLAVAGLTRLGRAAEMTESLPLDVMLPAVGQGALGLECRSDDQPLLAVLAPLDDSHTHAAVLAERALLHTLRGGCLAPVGAHSQVDSSGQLTLSAVVLSLDGRQRIAQSAEGAFDAPEDLGNRLAQSMLAAGADQLIAQLRS
jgi:hydroxymethylbilane synthase